MADGPRFDVVLIDAGPTTWDLAGRLAGRIDLPLAPEGVVAVNRACEPLSSLRSPLVLCGPDEASLAAGKIVGQQLRAKPKSLAGLAAMDLGLWQGMTLDQLSDRCPKVCKTMQCDPSTIVPPNGEPWTEAKTRIVGAFLGALPRNPGSTIVVVARPGTLVVLRAGIDELSGRTIERDCTAEPSWGEAERVTLELTGAAAGGGGWLSMFSVMGVMGAVAMVGAVGTFAGGWPSR